MTVELDNFRYKCQIWNLKVPLTFYNILKKALVGYLGNGHTKTFKHGHI